MKLNQALHGLERGHSYRLEGWPEGTYIKKGENDMISLFTNDNLNDKHWTPTYEQAFNNTWVATDSISAPGPTPADKVGGLLRKLEGLPVGTVLTHYTQVDTVDLAFFDDATQHLVFQYRDEQGTVMPSDPTIALMQLPEWVNGFEPAAELTPPMTEEPDMNISNHEEITKLCLPLQERLRANDNFKRIEIPIADAGFQVEGQDASLLISITREEIRLHVHVDGHELENVDFEINQRLIAGPISQREAKPLSAIAVPNFMVRGQLQDPTDGGGIPDVDNRQTPDRNIDMAAGGVGDVTLRSTFEPELQIPGLPDTDIELGTYRTLGTDSRYFEAGKCENGLVFGTFLPGGNAEDLVVVSANLFELMFKRLPKISKGVRLQLDGVGTQVVVSEVGEDSAIIDIDLGFSTTAAELPLAELQSDKWIFVSFDKNYGQPKTEQAEQETPAEAQA